MENEEGETPQAPRTVSRFESQLDALASEERPRRNQRKSTAKRTRTATRGARGAKRRRRRTLQAGLEEDDDDEEEQDQEDQDQNQLSPGSSGGSAGENDAEADIDNEEVYGSDEGDNYAEESYEEDADTNLNPQANSGDSGSEGEGSDNSRRDNDKLDEQENAYTPAGSDVPRQSRGRQTSGKSTRSRWSLGLLDEETGEARYLENENTQGGLLSSPRQTAPRSAVRFDETVRKERSATAAQPQMSRRQEELALEEAEAEEAVNTVLGTLETALEGRQAQGHAFEEVNVENLLDDLLGISQGQGLSNQNLVRVLKLAGHRRCKKSEVAVLVRSLLPREPVDEAVIVELLGLFPSMSLKCKSLALKWLVLVNRKLSRPGTEALHKCYGVLFHYIDYESTRAILCRLLYMLTRRKDVSVFRAERLGSLIGNQIETGQDAGPLLLLNDLYAQYAPDLLGVAPAKFTRPRLGFFRSPDEAWGAAIEAVSRRERSRARESVREASYDRQNNEKLEDLARTTVKERHPDRSKGQRRRGRPTAAELNAKGVEGLPEALSSRTRDDEVNVGEVRSTRELANALAKGKLVFPDRCSAILRDTMFQYLLCVEPRDDQVMRLRQTLPYLIEEDFFSLRRGAIGSASRPLSRHSKDNDERARSALLSSQETLMIAMAEFADFMQQTLPEFENFVIRYLETWNGVHHTLPLLRLIARLQPRSYEDLRRDILMPLHRVFQTADIEAKAHILNCLHELIRNWAEIDWESHMDRAREQDDSTSTTNGSKQLQHRFVPLPGGVNYFKVLFELIGFLDQLLVMGLVLEDDHAYIQVIAADVFSTMARLHSDHGLPFIVPPSPGIVYRMLLSPSCVGVSAMGQVLVDFLQGFSRLREDIQAKYGNEAAGARHASKQGFNNGTNKIDLFNAYIWDYCQVLWFNTPLPKQSEDEADAVSSLLFRNAQERGLLNAFTRVGMSRGDVGYALGMTSGAAFSGLAADLAERTGLDSVKELETIDFLRHLQKNHCTGLYNFMTTYIAALNS